MVAPAKATLRLLGNFELEIDSKAVRFPTRKAEALLAFLANSPGTTHTREKLATLLWTDSADAQSRQSLRQTLFSVRRLLPDRDALISDGDRIGIAVDSFAIDVVQLRQLVSSDKTDDLVRISELYRGPFLDGFSTGEDEFDLWLDRERETLRDQVLGARTRLMEHLAGSDPENALTVGLAILAEDPLRETVHAQVIALYDRMGRRAAAAKQYNTCADILWRRLGVRPSRATRELYERIVREEEVLDTASNAPHVMPQRVSNSVHVLLVEDNELNQEVIRASLKGTRYELTVVGDGAAALLELGRRRFDLALVDIELPFVSGFTLIEAMKKNGLEMPVIVLTSHQETEHEVNALTIGAEDFLRKPIQRDVLLMRIERVLRSASGGRGSGRG